MVPGSSFTGRVDMGSNPHIYSTKISAWYSEVAARYYKLRKVPFSKLVKKCIFCTKMQLK